MWVGLGMTLACPPSRIFYNIIARVERGEVGALGETSGERESERGSIGNFIPRGALALPEFCGLFKNSKYECFKLQSGLLNLDRGLGNSISQTLVISKNLDIAIYVDVASLRGISTTPTTTMSFICMAIKETFSIAKAF